MNNYFCEVGKNLSKQIKIVNAKTKPVKTNPKSIFINPTNSEEVSKIIKNLKDKAGGDDKINAKTIKEIETNISLPLAHIFNISIEKSVWPDALKSAIVIAIHKQGDKTNIANYRPISLISNLAKIFERIIYNRIYSFVQKVTFFHNINTGLLKKRVLRMHSIIKWLT